MEKLPIYWLNGKKYVLVGSVWRNDDGSFGIDFQKEKVPESLWPVQIFGIDGTCKPNSDSIYFWLSCRVVPETRQNLLDFLRAYNLDHYDVWDFLKASDGNVGTDTLYIGDPNRWK